MSITLNGTTGIDLPVALTVSEGGTGLTSPGTSGNVLTSNGTAWLSTTPAVTYAGARTELFVASGTWTPPTGVTNATVVVIGGGGSTNGSGNGGSGGTSSFGTYVSATGGSGGNDVNATNGVAGTGTVSVGTAIKISNITTNRILYGISGLAARPGTGSTVAPIAYSAASTFAPGATGSYTTTGGTGGYAIAAVSGLSGPITITVGVGGTGTTSSGVNGAVLIMY